MFIARPCRNYAATCSPFQPDNVLDMSGVQFLSATGPTVLLDLHNRLGRVTHAWSSLVSAGTVQDAAQLIEDDEKIRTAWSNRANDCSSSAGVPRRELASPTKGSAMRMIIRATVLLLTAVVLVLVEPGAVAQAAPAGQVSAQDKAFLRAAHQSNLAEIATGKLAKRKGKSEKVRELGNMFFEDHTKLDADLKKVAKKLDVDLPSKPNAEQRALAAKLEKLDGSTFDKTWLDGQIVRHRKAKANGDRQLKKGSNRTAVTVAKKSAPIVKHHLHELLDARKHYANND